MRKLISLVLTFSLISQTLLIPLSISAQSLPSTPVEPSPFARSTSSPHGVGSTGQAFHPQVLSSTIYPLSSNYVYDSSGNLTFDGQRTITYDASGMPSLITKGNTVVNFIYDGGGQRIAKIVKVNGKLQSSTIYFGNIEKEIDYPPPGGPSTTTITKYYFAGGKRIALRKDNGDSVFLTKDHLSSSTLFTDSSGNKKDTLLTYQPYGTERSNWDLPSTPPAGGPPSNHLYTDQIKDPETDLYYYNARYYSPQIGMFISPDTAGDKLNKYAYTSNNPIMFNDPTGHQVQSFLRGLFKKLFIVGAWIKGTGLAMESYVDSVYQGSQMGIPLENYNSQWGYMGFSGLSGFVPPPPKTSSLSNPIFINEEAHQEMSQTTQSTQQIGDILMAGGTIRAIGELSGPSQEADPKVKKLLSNTEEKYGLKVQYEPNAKLPLFAIARHEYDPQTGISTMYGPVKKITEMHELGHAYSAQVKGEIIPNTLQNQWYDTHPVQALKSEIKADLFASREMFEANEPFYSFFYGANSLAEPLNVFLFWLSGKIAR